ncbi:MAG: hypothetical protein ACFFCD_00755 [Promethearchaeota archaeon]
MVTKTYYSPTLEIAGAALFGALSIVVSFSAAFIPRLPWGIALLDPISIVWIVCFLIFGIRSGIICSVAGTIGLMFFDPFAPIGPFMKLAATLPMMIIPLLILRATREKGSSSGRDFASTKLWFSSGLIATLVRIVIMLPLVIIVVSLLFGTPLMEIVTGVLILNAWQSAWDIAVPWIIVFPTKIYEKYCIW